jgi:hypothetical protein
MSKIRFIGLDVHADTIAVAVAEPDGEVRSLGLIPNRLESIRKLVAKLGPGHTERRILLFFMRCGLAAQPAFLGRGSSRRIMTMRFRPADIRVINRRIRLLSCHPRCAFSSRGSPGLLTTSPHIRKSNLRSVARWIKAGNRLFLRRLKQPLIGTHEARLVTSRVLFEHQTTRQLNGIVGAQCVPTH